MNPLIWALNRERWAKEELGISPRQFQKDILKSKARRQIACTHRQAGKTSAAGMVATHNLIYTHYHSVIASPTFKQSERMARGVRGYLKKCTHTPDLTVDNKFYIETSNGSTLDIISLDSPDNIRGLAGIQWLCIDEAAAVSPEAFAALTPALAAVKDSQQLIISTPRGMIGLFWELWNNPSYEKYFLSADQNPDIDAGYLEQERIALGEHLFQQEYLCNFASIASCVFNLDKFYSAVDPKLSAVKL